MSSDTAPQDPGRSVYVTVSTEEIHRTHHHSADTINVDVDCDGVPVGIEVLGAIKVGIDGAEVQQPQAIGAADIEKVAEVLRECRRVVRDEPDYDVFCAKRVLSALQGET